MTMSFDDFRHLCEQRRSIRYFDKGPLTAEEILSVLDVANMAPSVENIQPWKFHVVMSGDVLTKLRDAPCYGNFIEGAAAFVIVTCDQTARPGTGETLWHPRELEYSCVAAMENIVLGATARGLASCWVSLHQGVVHEVLRLPPTESVIGGILLGHWKRGEEKAVEGHRSSSVREHVVFHE